MKSPFLKNGAENMRFKFYADKTINAYTYWIKICIYFNHKR